MTKVLGLALAGALSLGIAAPAQAGFFSFTGGTAGTIPGPGGVNDYLGPLFGGASSLSGYYGSQINVSVPGSGTITIEYFGAEATFNNEFNFAGGELFDHPGGSIIASDLNSPLATFATAISGSGLLDFSFDFQSDAGSVVNGFNPDDSGHAAMANFFASCSPTGPGNPATCDTIYLFLDDAGNGPDDNHDDFLVRMTISETAVPEPATLSIFGAGLLATYIARRRRQK